jgi:hypothetical protein
MENEKINKAYALDLDALVPEAVQVKLGGEIIDVYPPDIETFILLTRLSSRQQFDTADSVRGGLEEIKDAIATCVPDLKKKNITLKISQALALLQFIVKLAQPNEKEVGEQIGVSIAEKKMIAGDQPQSDSAA